MEYFSVIWEFGIPFLVALTILIFVHEVGHYWVARRCGVRVEVFSIGFGPEIRGWTDSHGTRWKLSAVPLGGYVKMFGESDTLEGEDGEEREMTDQEKAVSFHHKPLAQRAAVVFAGPAVNYLFAVIVFAFLFMAVGVPKQLGDNPPALAGVIEPGSAAALAGIERGDLIVQIGEHPIESFARLREIVSASPGVALPFIVLREGKRITLRVTPKLTQRKGKQGETLEIGLIGVHLGSEFVSQNPLASVWLAIKRTVKLNADILAYLGDVISGGREPDELGGIIRIAHISGQVAQFGLVSYLSFLAVLSVNLGLINLLPIPVLDGGHLVFYLIELVLGRPLGAKAQEYGFGLGLAFVLALFLFVTWNDLVYFKVFEFITGLFT